MEPKTLDQGDQQSAPEVRSHYELLETSEHDLGIVTIDTIGSLSIKLLTSDQQQRAFTLWQQIESSVAETPIACSTVWTKTWLKHYGDVVAHRFVVASINDQPIGIALLTEGVKQRKGHLAANSLHLGTAGEPDADSLCVEYNDLLVLPTYRNTFIIALNRLFNSESNWDQFCIDGWEANDFQEHFQPEQTNWKLREVRSFYHNLAQARIDEKTAYNQLGYATRKTVRKNLKAYRELKYEWAETVEQAEDIFNDLVQLHQARWIDAGEPGAYASERFVNFHREIIQQLLPEKKVGLFRLSDEEGILGCVHVFIDRNRALAYQGGTVPFTKKKSPGLLVDLYCMEECLQRGLDAYDFLGGEMHHKERLSTDFNTLVWVKHRRKRLKFLFTNIARQCKHLIVKED